ncbi:M60 family metallopeptidase [Collinsella sp. An2]|uniref:M60 family metallopeptidase n=1 Tax=Collinsella sp. An2 TaxID=1965585 RepID=UPI000B3A9203|nr:M60 family metallopeptidase [Collinsella sp. An2]OUP09809.1 hypothetical protein B5F33_04275 [Collinsella sp. An2]
MPHNRIAPAILGGLLAVSLAPASIDAAKHPSISAGLSAHASLESALATDSASATETLPDSNAIFESDTALVDAMAPESEPVADADIPEGAHSSGKAHTIDPTENADNANTGTSEEGADSVITHTVTIVRDGEQLGFATLAEAFATAQNGEVIEVSSDQLINEPIELDGGRAVTLRATDQCTIARADTFAQVNGKAAGMFRLRGGSSLVLESTGGALTLDGTDTDSDEAIVTLYDQSSFAMRAGTAIARAHCSWKPWGAVYVRSGTFVLDGGEIRDGFSMRNTAVAVEAGSTFELREGSIKNNRASYSQSMVWAKGTIRMTGGTISGNSSNVSNDGVVHVLAGGSFAFTGGAIGANSMQTPCGIMVDAQATLTLGDQARLENGERVYLHDNSTLVFESVLARHSITDPLNIVLMDRRGEGREVARCASSDVARATIGRLSVLSDTDPVAAVSAIIDPDNPERIAVLAHAASEVFAWLDEPFADDLGLTLRDELLVDGVFMTMRERIEEHFANAPTPEYEVRLAQLDRLERYATYLADNRDAIEDSVMSVSQLGSPAEEKQRTQQVFSFDNLDVTGYYLKPGMVHDLNLYVEAADPSKLSLAWRQAGRTDSNSYTSLNLHQKSQLASGLNRITVDLTESRYGYMVFLRNDAQDNPARARLESADVIEAGTAPVVGNSLGVHPFYEHDPTKPEAFWGFVQELRDYASKAHAGEAADMTLLQMGDEGHAQFSISATALAAAYDGIASRDDAIAYIERSNDAIQQRLEFFWAYDGFDPREQSGPNAVSPMRVHTAFTSTVWSPSTMYAFERYFHMPESDAASFLSGESMYGWGMSHEYGHCLDNAVISVAEETNNLYSLAGSRHGGIADANARGVAFSPDAYYHVNALAATRRWDNELARMAADPTYTPDWYNGGDWETYIWTHLMAWWNGLHFFNTWNYADYDFDASPYTPATASDVQRFGAYGASMRVLRGDAEAVRAIEQTTTGISDDTVRRYNRIAMAFTMGTGYDFAAYLYDMGQRDLAPEVLAYCAQYPTMPRKVQYFSLDTDAAVINGAGAYTEAVTPQVTAQVEAGTVHITAQMATDELGRSTTAYELYRGNKLVGFSRTGSFSVAVDEMVEDGERDGNGGADDLTSYRVVAYDVELNPSNLGRIDGVDSELPDEGEDAETPETGDGEDGSDNDDGDAGGSGSGDGDAGAGEEPGSDNEDDDSVSGGGNDGSDAGDSDGSGDGDGSGSGDNGSDGEPGDDAGGDDDTGAGSGSDEGPGSPDGDVNGTPDDTEDESVPGDSDQPSTDPGKDSDDEPEDGQPGGNTGNEPEGGKPGGSTDGEPGDGSEGQPDTPDGDGSGSSTNGPNGDGAGDPAGSTNNQGTGTTPDVDDAAASGGNAAHPAGGTLAQTGDGSHLSAFVAVLGSVLAFTGAAIAARLRRR